MEAEQALSCLFAMMHILSELKLTVLKLLRHRGKAWREKGTVLELLINRISEVADMYRSRGGRLLPYMRASLDSWLSRFDNLCSFEYTPWIWEEFWDDPDFDSYDPDHEVMLGLELRLQSLRKRKATDYEDDECEEQEEKADEEGNESQSTRGISLTLGQAQKRITSFRTRFRARGG
jgi:hypothetical protein